MKDQQSLALERIHLVTCAGVEREGALLNHFITHYRALGIPVENFHVVLNTHRADSNRLRDAVQTLTSNGITPEETWIAPYTSDAMWQKRRDVQRRCVPESEWVISADLDEFHEYPEPLPAFLAYCESIGVSCVDGVFIDRVAENGQLAAVDPNRFIWEAFPVQAMVQGTLVGQQGQHIGWEGTTKLMAFKGGLFPARGGHGLIDYRPQLKYLYGRRLVEFPYVGNPAFRFALPTRVHHFKWTATLRDSLEERLNTPGVSIAGAEYGRQLKQYLDTHDGLALADAPQHVPGSLPGFKIGWRRRAQALRILHKGRRAGQRGKQAVQSVRRRLKK